MYPKKKIYLGLKGKNIHSTRTTLVFNDEEYHIKNESSGPLFKFDISEQNIKEMKKTGIDKLTKMMKKNHLTTNENKLLKSIDFYANAEIQKNIENKFLSLMTCNEILFSKEKAISSSIAFGVSHILSNELDQQNEIFEQVKNLYNIRCNITHSGIKNINESELFRLKYITREVINQLIKNPDDLNKIEEISDKLFNE